MFRRLLWQMMMGNRGRLTVALVAIVSGAAVISALLNLQFDAERKLTQEFRVLGANVVIAPAQGAQSATTATDSAVDSPSLIDEGAGLRPLASERFIGVRLAFGVRAHRGTPLPVTTARPPKAADARTPLAAWSACT